MRQAVRAVVIRDGALLVMYRNKMGRKYYTLIGGDIDPGESQAIALYREIEEETGVKVANHRLVFVEEPADRNYPQYIYLCDYVSGEPALAPDSIEAKALRFGLNIHKPMWMPLEELAEVRFLSPLLRDRLLQSVREGWPSQPERIVHGGASRAADQEANQGGKK